MASLQSDNEKIVVCTSRKEMLETLEEYKRETQSGWRCINTNALFGRFFLLSFEYIFMICKFCTHAINSCIDMDRTKKSYCALSTYEYKASFRSYRI